MVTIVNTMMRSVCHEELTQGFQWGQDFGAFPSSVVALTWQTHWTPLTETVGHRQRTSGYIALVCNAFKATLEHSFPSVPSPFPPPTFTLPFPRISVVGDPFIPVLSGRWLRALTPQTSLQANFLFLGKFSVVNTISCDCFPVLLS